MGRVSLIVAADDECRHIDRAEFVERQERSRTGNLPEGLGDRRGVPVQSCPVEGQSLDRLRDFRVVESRGDLCREGLGAASHKCLGPGVPTVLSGSIQATAEYWTDQDQGGDAIWVGKRPGCRRMATHRVAPDHDLTRDRTFGDEAIEVLNEKFITVALAFRGGVRRPVPSGVIGVNSISGSRQGP
jgi:hypothetical protein